MMATQLSEAHEVPCPHCGGSGKVTIPAGVETVECYYFGCWHDSGHYWRDKGGYKSSREIDAALPEIFRRRIDGVYCPGTIPGQDYKRTRPEVEGEAALHHYVEGWTVLAYWDRSVDKRGASNSAFVARGVHDFATMLAIARAQYPHVLTRRTRPIILVETSP